MIETYFGGAKIPKDVAWAQGKGKQNGGPRATAGIGQDEALLTKVIAFCYDRLSFSWALGNRILGDSFARFDKYHHGRKNRADARGKKVRRIEWWRAWRRWIFNGC